MTDEERREAERFARSYADEGQLTSVLIARREGRYEGYMAACEAKRASFGKQSQGGKTMLTLLEAERARIVKLRDALKFYATGGAGQVAGGLAVVALNRDDEAAKRD